MSKAILSTLCGWIWEISEITGIGLGPLAPGVRRHDRRHAPAPSGQRLHDQGTP